MRNLHNFISGISLLSSGAHFPLLIFFILIEAIPPQPRLLFSCLSAFLWCYKNNCQTIGALKRNKNQMEIEPGAHERVGVWVGLPGSGERIVNLQQQINFVTGKQ